MRAATWHSMTKLGLSSPPWFLTMVWRQFGVIASTTTMSTCCAPCLFCSYQEAYFNGIFYLYIIMKWGNFLNICDLYNGTCRPTTIAGAATRVILCMHPANKRRRYIVTSPLIGWAHTQNDPCCYNGTMSRSQVSATDMKIGQLRVPRRQMRPGD